MSQVRKEIKLLKKKIISFLIVVFMFVMVFSIVNVGMAANTGTSTATQNINAGTLAIVVTSTLAFTNYTLLATTGFSNADLDGVNVTDSRGSLAGWTATLWSNNLVEAGSNIISAAAKLNVNPGVATTVSNATDGSSFMMPVTAATAATVMSATASNGWSQSNLDNTVVNLVVDPGVKAGTYTSVMTVTVT